MNYLLLAHTMIIMWILLYMLIIRVSHSDDWYWCPECEHVCRHVQTPIKDCIVCPHHD